MTPEDIIKQAVYDIERLVTRNYDLRRCASSLEDAAIVCERYAVEEMPKEENMGENAVIASIRIRVAEELARRIRDLQK